jgi:hypothetical protein
MNVRYGLSRLVRQKLVSSEKSLRIVGEWLHNGKLVLLGLVKEGCGPGLFTPTAGCGSEPSMQAIERRFNTQDTICSVLEVRNCNILTKTLY